MRLVQGSIQPPKPVITSSPATIKTPAFIGSGASLAGLQADSVQFGGFNDWKEKRADGKRAKTEAKLAQAEAEKQAHREYMNEVKIDFLKSVRTGDNDAVRSALSKDAIINPHQMSMPDGSVAYPLLEALNSVKNEQNTIEVQKNIELVLLLVQFGADPNLVINNETLLSIFTKGNKPYAVESLLRLNLNGEKHVAASVAKKDDLGNTPLATALLAGSKEMATVHASYLPEDLILSIDQNGDYPLHVAAWQNMPSVFANILESEFVGMDMINTPDHNGLLPVDYLIHNQDKKNLSELLAYNELSLLHKSGTDELSLMHRAARVGRMDFAEVLKNAFDQTGNASYQYLDVTNKAKRSPVMEAVLYQQQEMLMFFLKNKAKLDYTDKQGNTLLHLAFKPERERVFETGLSTPSAMSVDAPTNRAMVIRLLDKQVDVDTPNNKGVTPAMLAVEEGRLDLLEMLIQYGADTSQVTYDGRDIQSFLPEDHPLTEKLSALLEKANDYQVNPIDAQLFWAAQDSNLPLIQTLVKARGNLHTRSKSGKTLLMVAAEQSNLPLINYLIAQGVDPTAKTYDGDTSALSIAKAKGNQQIQKDVKSAISRWNLNSKKRNAELGNDEGDT